MSKTFTCKELGGICDAAFSGETFPEIIDKAMPHMMSDDAHKAKMTNMPKVAPMTKEQWFEKMQAEFNARKAD